MNIQLSNNIYEYEDEENLINADYLQGHPASDFILDPEEKNSGDYLTVENGSWVARAGGGGGVEIPVITISNSQINEDFTEISNLTTEQKAILTNTSYNFLKAKVETNPNSYVYFLLQRNYLDADNDEYHYFNYCDGGDEWFENISWEYEQGTNIITVSHFDSSVPLPEAEEAGTIAIYNGDSWIAQEGYGYKEIQETYIEYEIELDNWSPYEGKYVNLGHTENLYDEIEVNKEYKIKWNGVTYTCTAFSLEDYNGTIGLGNKAFLGGDDTEEPFLYAKSMTIDESTIEDCWGSINNDDVVLSVYYEETEIIEIDEELIPNTIPTVELEGTEKEDDTGTYIEINDDLKNIIINDKNQIITFYWDEYGLTCPKITIGDSMVFKAELIDFVEISFVYDQEKPNKLYILLKPTYEPDSVQFSPNSWTVVDGMSPYTHSAVKTISWLPDYNDTVVELINNKPVLFAKHGFAISKIENKDITFLSIGKPEDEVALRIEVTQIAH